MAPELLDGRIGPEADVFAVGITLLMIICNHAETVSRESGSVLGYYKHYYAVCRVFLCEAVYILLRLCNRIGLPGLSRSSYPLGYL
eukprot:gene121-biopygen8882